jgi:hypothetical protein
VSDRVTRCGKQVILDGQHFADAADERAAEVIVAAITYAGLPADRIPPAQDDLLREFFA